MAGEGDRQHRLGDPEHGVHEIGPGTILYDEALLPVFVILAINRAADRGTWFSLRVHLSNSIVQVVAE